MCSTFAAEAGGPRGDANHRLRIATFNCSTLKGRLEKLLMLVQENDIDVCVLQEVRIPFDSLRAKRRLVESWGYKLLANCKPGERGSAGGLAVIARTDVDMIKSPMDESKNGRRSMYVRVGRINSRPVRVANIHGQHRPSQLRKMVDEVTEHLAKLGGERMVIGDFNCTPDDGIVTPFLACGVFHLADSELECLSPTRKPTAHQGARHVDYAIHSSGVRILGRGVIEAPFSDHHLVWYDIPSEEDAPKQKWAPRAKLERRKVGPGEWEECFGELRSEYEDHNAAGRSAQAWEMFSAATEKILAAEGENLAVNPRHQLKGPRAEMPTSKHGETTQSTVVRRLLRARRRKVEIWNS